MTDPRPKPLTASLQAILQSARDMDSMAADDGSRLVQVTRPVFRDLIIDPLAAAIAAERESRDGLHALGYREGYRAAERARPPQAEGRLRAALESLTLATSNYLALEYATGRPPTHARLRVEVEKARTALRAEATRDEGLDAAWREAEAALPEGWLFHGVTLPDNSMDGGGWGPGWVASMSWPDHCEYDDCDHDEAFRVGTGPTPAAALRALAAALATPAPKP